MLLKEQKQLIEEFTKSNGISHWGMAPLSAPENNRNAIEAYEKWIQQSYHGTMGYLESSLATKKTPANHFLGIKTALVFAFPYVPHPESKTLLPGLRIAAYAQGLDYHKWIDTKLSGLVEKLKTPFPQSIFLIATDSKPILERDLAHRAGLGWVGKNTCLIHPKNGSLFFIAEILTDLPIQDTVELSHDFCGTCTRCIDACPTGAIEGPRILNANKCISYLTIETKEIPDKKLQARMQDWFFGCDICQTVCPWNQKIIKTNPTELQRPQNSEQREKDLKFILTSSGKTLEKHFYGTALSRAGSFGLRKNALIIIRNEKIKELAPEVKLWCDHERLGPLAKDVFEELSQRN